MVRFEHVTKTFADTNTEALLDVTFHILPGQLCFLVGESGCGKTTLLKLLLHEFSADSGSVYVNGQDVGALRRGEIPAYRRKTGFVFQDYRLMAGRNVYENVALAGIVSGARERDIRRHVAMALQMVGLEGYYGRDISQLSGGERQRVAIARAIAGAPQLLLADEPTGNLDGDSARSVLLLFERIHRALGLTMVIATHDYDRIAGFGDRTLCLREGRLLEGAGGVD